jgi:MoaA/NifB/PqqE/SkfB family radical SAM enzyme
MARQPRFTTHFAASLWSVFFLVPTGRGATTDFISAEEFEQAFEKLYETSHRVKLDIKAQKLSTTIASS